MKIRTITLGMSESPTPGLISWAGKQLQRAVDHFASQGYSIQSRRIALAHWDFGLGRLSVPQRTEVLHMVDAACAKNEIDFCSVGMMRVPSQINHVAQVLGETSRLNASVDVGCIGRGLDHAAISAVAEAITYLASNTPEGIGNFRLGAGFCLEPNSPFFPGSYHREALPAFTIGFENSDTLVEAFSGSGNLEMARERLFSLLQEEYRTVEASANKLSEALDLTFEGLDTSIVPSLVSEESIVEAFRGVGIEFGNRGTLAACGVVTDVVKSLAVKRTGYCGIMLPVLEDAGLAEMIAKQYERNGIDAALVDMSLGHSASKSPLGITDLLTYASVCGVGVDMVPIPGNVALQQLEALLLDVGTMALKLSKPLSVRVLPSPGKHVGDRTQLSSPYLCNSRVVAI